MYLKSQEEIDGILQVFPETYERKAGEPLTKEALITYLENRMADLQYKLIHECVSHLNVKELGMLLCSVNTNWDKDDKETQEANPTKNVNGIT